MAPSRNGLSARPPGAAVPLRRALTDRWFLAALLAAVPAVLLMPAAGIAPPALPADPSARAIFALQVVLVFPLLEEAVFRGLIQATLLELGSVRRLMPGISVANVAASLLFALAHVLLQGIPEAALVIVPSLVLGAVFERHRGLATPVILHAAYNAAWLAGIVCCSGR